MRYNLIYIILVIIFLLIIYFYFLENKTCEPPLPPDDGDTKDDCKTCLKCDDGTDPTCNNSGDCPTCVICTPASEDPVCLTSYNSICDTNTLDGSNPVESNSVGLAITTAQTLNTVNISWTVANSFRVNTYNNYLYFTACLITNTGVCVAGTMSDKIYYTGSSSDMSYSISNFTDTGCYIAKVRPALKNCNEYFDDSFSKQISLGGVNMCMTKKTPIVGPIVLVNGTSKNRGNTGDNNIISEFDSIDAAATGSAKLEIYNNAFYDDSYGGSTTYKLIWGIYSEDDKYNSKTFTITINNDSGTKIQSFDIKYDESGDGYTSIRSPIAGDSSIVVYNYELNIKAYADSIIEVVISYQDVVGNTKSSNTLSLSVYDVSKKYPVSNICYSIDDNSYINDDPYYCTTGSKININWTLPEDTPGVPPRTLTYTLNFIKNPVTNTDPPICSYVVDSNLNTINVIFRDDDTDEVCYISSDNTTIIIPGDIKDNVHFNIVTNIAEYDEYDTDKDKSIPTDGPVFTIVECIEDNDCTTGNICDITTHTCTLPVIDGCYKVSDITFKNENDVIVRAFGVDSQLKLSWLPYENLNSVIIVCYTWEIIDVHNNDNLIFSCTVDSTKTGVIDSEGRINVHIKFDSLKPYESVIYCTTTSFDVTINLAPGNYNIQVTPIPPPNSGYITTTTVLGKSSFFVDLICTATDCRTLNKICYDSGGLCNNNLEELIVTPTYKDGWDNRCDNGKPVSSSGCGSNHNIIDPYMYMEPTNKLLHENNEDSFYFYIDFSNTKYNPTRVNFNVRIVAEFRYKTGEHVDKIVYCPTSETPFCANEFVGKVDNMTDNYYSPVQCIGNNGEGKYKYYIDYVTALNNMVIKPTGINNLAGFWNTQIAISLVTPPLCNIVTEGMTTCNAVEIGGIALEYSFYIFDPTNPGISKFYYNKTPSVYKQTDSLLVSWLQPFVEVDYYDTDLLYFEPYIYSYEIYENTENTLVYSFTSTVTDNLKYRELRLDINKLDFGDYYFEIYAATPRDIEKSNIGTGFKTDTFTVVEECLIDNDCDGNSNGNMCDITSHTCTVACLEDNDCDSSICDITTGICINPVYCPYEITDDDFNYYTDSSYGTPVTIHSYIFGETIYIKWTADLSVKTTYQWQILNVDDETTSITGICDSNSSGSDANATINIYGSCLDGNTGECDTVKLGAGTYNIKITYNNVKCPISSYITGITKQFKVTDNTDYSDFDVCTPFDPDSYQATTYDFNSYCYNDDDDDYTKYCDGNYINYCDLIPTCSTVRDFTTQSGDYANLEYGNYCIESGGAKTYVLYWNCYNLNKTFNLNYNPKEVYFYMNIYCDYLTDVNGNQGTTKQAPIQTITIKNKDYLESGCEYGDGDNMTLYSFDIGEYLTYGPTLYTIIIKTVVKINGFYYISEIQEDPRISTEINGISGFILQVSCSDTELPVSNLKYYNVILGNRLDTIVYKNGDALNVSFDDSIYNALLLGQMGQDTLDNDLSEPIKYDYNLMNYNDDTKVDGVEGQCSGSGIDSNIDFNISTSNASNNNICTVRGGSSPVTTVYLKAGNKYYFEILTSWNYCEDSKVTTTIFKDNYFTIVECSENNDCDSSICDNNSCVECLGNNDCDGNSDGNICDNNSCVICSSTEGCSKPQSSTLLETDSYARMAYEVNCSYADDISKCMSKQGYPNFDQREIPTTCQVDSKTNKNICAREECPPMSTPYTTDGVNFAAGCITPLNTNENSDIKYDYSFNTQPTNKAASYDNPNFQDNTYNPLYGYPFIAIIEGGTLTSDNSKPVFNSDNILDDLTQTSEKIAVPGMTDGKNVYLMPVDLQNFHPFIAWRTFSSVKDDGTNPYTPYDSNSYGTSLYSESEWNPSILFAIYNLYHIGSLKYLNTNRNICGSSKGDNGKSCDLTMVNISTIKRPVDDQGEDVFQSCETPSTKSGYNYNSCMTSSIWLDKIDANFNNNPTLDILYNLPKDYTNDNGKLKGTSYTNNWNVPIDDKQNMVFFGKTTDVYASLYHRNDSGNKISHMRRWYIGDDVKSNSYFWTKGLGKVIGSNKPSIDEVYKVLAEQWPNGPPYSAPTDRGTKVINFSAPIQYGIVPAYKQTGFYLEAYSWDSTYKTFKGLGFISDSNIDKYESMLSNNYAKYKIWANPININGVVTINDITISSSTNLRMYYRYPTIIGKNPEYMKFSLSASTLNPAKINILKNGYITMNSTDSIHFNTNYNYILSVANLSKELYWVLSGTALMNPSNKDFTSLASIDFTPIMLAMSWPWPS
jgi:hypothetical protein